MVVKAKLPMLGLIIYFEPQLLSSDFEYFMF